MKDRQTQRAVKNILHNELGITNEKIEVLIRDFINKKFEDQVGRFLKSAHFEYLVNKQLEKKIDPFIRTALKDQLAGISIIVKKS